MSTSKVVSGEGGRERRAESLRLMSAHSSAIRWLHCIIRHPVVTA
ncbi:hypothetical protein TSMEX_006184 [Taenia solium]|eukprot:TsM_000308700 transcript=TsM_000308700 gene=TsM_000308700